MARMFVDTAAERPDAPALIDDRGSTTWAALSRRTNQLVHALRAAGLAPGDTVALLSGNRREYFEVMAAGMHAGLFVVPVNWHWVARELAYVIDNADAAALIVDDAFLRVAEEAVRAPETARCRLRVAMTDRPPRGLRGLRGAARSATGRRARRSARRGADVLHLRHHRLSQGRPHFHRSDGRRSRHAGRARAGPPRAARRADRRHEPPLRPRLPQRAVGVLDAAARRGEHHRDAAPLRPGGDPGAHRPPPRHQPPPGADAVHPHAEASRRDPGRVRR